MKSIFKATAILSGGSFVTIVVGLASAKVMALVLRPAGYGYYGLLQSFLAVTTLVAGMGIMTGLVRLGAGPIASHDEATISSLRKASWWLFCGLGGVALLVLAALRAPISQWALGTPDQSTIIVLMGIALLFTIAGQIQSGTLNAYHRVKALAQCAVASSILSATVSITCILLWRTHGVVPAVIGGSAVGFLVATHFLRREVGPVRARPNRREILKATRSLLHFGGPYTASMLIGSGVQLALPMIVLHLIDTESVGYYKAAAAVSVGYLGFLVLAMGQDYYPRVSAVKDQPTALVKLINEQHRLVMILAVPMILVTLALVPYLIPIVYSSKFAPAVAILEWQLIGDIFKFSSWTMAYVILARCSSWTYFLTESLGGVVAIATTWLSVRWFGLPGLGISFLVTYIIYYSIVWVIIRRDIPLVWTTANKKMMLAAIAAAILIRILPSTAFAHFRTPIALLLALGAGIPSLIVIWREFARERQAESGVILNSQGEATLTP